jgi:hypothetical protein
MQIYRKNAPSLGLEPRTDRLTVERSTIELRRNNFLRTQNYTNTLVFHQVKKMKSGNNGVELWAVGFEHIKNALFLIFVVLRIYNCINLPLIFDFPSI